MIAPNFSVFQPLAEQLADLARSTFRSLYPQGFDLSAKHDASPVTSIDVALEQALRAAIKAAQPDHAVWGEEGERESGIWLWILDPIDGTTALITGSPLFASLIALVHQGQAGIGVIEMPANSERWLGCGGKTVFQGLDESRTTCASSSCTKLAEATIAITRPAEQKATAELLRSCAYRRYGGDAYNFGCVAAGALDIAIDEQLEPHDYAALIPVVTGAGGTISDFTGQRPDCASPCNILACANQKLHRAALAVLRG